MRPHLRLPRADAGVRATLGFAQTPALLAVRVLPFAAAVALVLALATQAAAGLPPPPPDQAPGGPILVIASPGNPFTRYYAEILRAEGFNDFDLADIGAVDQADARRLRRRHPRRDVAGRGAGHDAHRLGARPAAT